MSVILAILKYLAFGMLGTVIFILFLYGVSKLLARFNDKQKSFLMFVILSVLFGIMFYAVDVDKAQEKQCIIESEEE